jgi:hypothetical protein
VRDGIMLDAGNANLASVTEPELIGIDDSGNVLFSANLSGGIGRAVFVSNVVAVPEPSAMTYILVAFLILSRATRKCFPKPPVYLRPSRL